MRLIAEEEIFDGYYVIVSSETNKTDDEIIDIYGGLWRIEETFKVTKSDLEDRFFLCHEKTILKLIF